MNKQFEQEEVAFDHDFTDLLKRDLHESQNAMPGFTSDVNNKLVLENTPIKILEKIPTSKKEKIFEEVKNPKIEIPLDLSKKTIFKQRKRKKKKKGGEDVIIHITKERIYKMTSMDMDEDLSDEEEYFGVHCETYDPNKIRKTKMKPNRIKGSNFYSRPIRQKSLSEEAILPEDIKEDFDDDLFVPISFEISDEGVIFTSVIRRWKFSIGKRLHEVKLEEVGITRKIILFLDSQEIFSSYT